MVVSAGLKAPPHGMPSTTSRNASSSFRPQSSGTKLAGPASPPGATSRPAARARALRRSVPPQSRSSSPVMTSMDIGTSSACSGIRVATTSTYSVWVGVGEGVGEGDWARTGSAPPITTAIVDALNFALSIRRF